MDSTLLLNVAGVVGLGATVVVAAAWLERALHRGAAGQPQLAHELVRADGHPDATPAEAFQHAEGAAAWTR